MPNETTIEERAFELSVVKSHHDSVSSLGSLSSLEDEEEAVVVVVEAAPPAVAARRRRSLSMNCPANSGVRRTKVIRRLKSTDAVPTIPRRCSAPECTDTDKERAATSLRMLLATQERRSRRFVFAESSTAKARNSLDSDFSIGQHSRLSRRRPSNITTSESSKALEAESSHSRSEHSCRWKAEYVCTDNNKCCTEDKVRLPQRKSSGDATAECRTELSSVERLAAHLSDAIKLVEEEPFIEDEGESFVEGQRESFVENEPVVEEVIAEDEPFVEDDEKAKRRSCRSKLHGREARRVSCSDMPKMPRRQTTKEGIRF